MFENMMKYEKAWMDFHEWVKKEHDELYVKLTHPIIGYKFKSYLLSTMPFFFDEKGIVLEPDNNSCTLYDYVNNKEYEIEGNDRQEALTKACEKTFEIYNNQLEGKQCM